jgi:hypothetical protein
MSNYAVYWYDCFDFSVIEVGAGRNYIWKFTHDTRSSCRAVDVDPLGVQLGRFTRRTPCVNL